MRTRLLFIATFALVAAPVLAGCAENDTKTTPTGSTTPTGTTPTSTTPTSTTPTSTTPVVTPPLPNLKLKMGLMMPITGALNALGEDMRDGAKMAIDEVNAAGVGLTIELVAVEDDGTTDSSGAPNKFNRLVGQDVTAVVGPCCSGVTGAILDLAVQNEIVVASPSATSPALTLDRENDGFFWRVSPSDAVQGKVLANLVLEDDLTSVNMIIVNNAYGTGLQRVFQAHFEANGGDVGIVEQYNEGAQEFSSAVTSVCATNAQGLVLVAYIDEGANILKALQSQNCLSKFKIYGSEGIYKGNGPEGLPAKAGQASDGSWLAAGVKGTNPESGELTTYNTKFSTKYGHEPGLYSAESYDGVMYIALAALAAKSTEGADIKAKLIDVANSGTKMNDFRTAALALLAGQDVDWQGAAHDFDYDPNHEPKTGIYAWWEVDQNGEVKTIAQGKSA